MTTVNRLILACIALLAAACSNTENTMDQKTDSAKAIVSGTVTYRERMLLTPAAELDIALLDVSKADALATTIASKTLTNIGQIPVKFTLEYDPALIQEGMSYNVRAEIRDRGRRMFTTDTAYPVLTRGHGKQVNMVLISMQSNPIRKPDASLTETYWKLIAIGENPYTPAKNQREAHLKLRRLNNAVEGSGGCNSFAGTYTLEDEKLSLGPLAMTAMACIEGMDTERDFALALAELNRYEIEGDTLRAFKDDELILRFEAIYLP
jgi:putative lipoprotein